MQEKYSGKRYKLIHANDIDATVPEWWALEGLRLMEEMLVVLPLVNRDYDDEFADAGEVVNIHTINRFSGADRKRDGQAVVMNDIEATPDTVKLNQHLTKGFWVTDREMQKSGIDLINKYLREAIRSIARSIDLIILTEGYEFLAQMVGQIGTDIGDGTILDLDAVMNNNDIDEEGRWLIVGANGKRSIMDVARFVEYQMTGTPGMIANNQIGSIRGFNVKRASQMMQINPVLSDTVVGAIDLTAGYAAGYAGAMVVDGFTGSVTVGTWLTIAGDMRPRRVKAFTLTVAATTGITLDTPLDFAVANNAVITTYLPGQVNLVAGYAAEWGDPIVYDTFTKDPQVGQGVSFGLKSAVDTAAEAAIYGIVKVDTTAKTILLNRPLEAAIANDAKINLLPGGDYNFSFIQDAITFVNRPLMPPAPGQGANSAVREAHGIAIRVTLSYDASIFRTRVVVDTLCGIKKLNGEYGVVVLQ